MSFDELTDYLPVVFADLDDTLFQTERKMAEPADASLLASRASNGSHSYMTAAQSATVQWLLATTRLIPTTARSSQVLKKTTIAFTDYKIASNGGAIIAPDGVHDPDWAAHAARVSSRHSTAFEAMEGAIAHLVDCADLRSWRVCEQETPVYFVVKVSAQAPEDVLDEVERLCRAEVGDDLLFHRNGRNMSFTPKGLAKIDAVNEMLSRLPNTDKRPIWGMGDSLSDLPFMQLCQMLVAPWNSQIAKTRLDA